MLVMRGLAWGIAGSGIADAVMLGVGLEIAGKWGC